MDFGIPLCSLQSHESMLKVSVSSALFFSIRQMYLCSADACVHRYSLYITCRDGDELRSKQYEGITSWMKT